MILSISSSEITLKGGNRAAFERILARNVRAALAPFGTFRVVMGNSRLIATSESDFDAGAAAKAAARTFGVDVVSLCHESPLEINEIERTALAHAEVSGRTFRVEAKRADKRFPLTSQQVNEIVGKALVDKGGKVNLSNPELTVFIDILSERAFISCERIRGPGGLPVGSSGKVLSLLSGGIDSPVASWMMMKRGCSVDFLHMHTVPDAETARNSKVMELAKIVRGYAPTHATIFMAPYTEFYKATTSVQPAYELVVFRRFLLRLGAEIAKKHGHKALVTGDSVGQVASQTLDNLFATNEAVQIPVFRPLVAFNKQEIVDLATKVGTYKLSLEPYKDCCSLVATKHPSTCVPLEKAKKIEDEINIGKIIEKTLAETKSFEV